MKFERSPSNPDAMTLDVGRMFLVAHRTGEWSVHQSDFVGTDVRGKATSWRNAQLSAVAKAREIVDGWARDMLADSDVDRLLTRAEAERVDAGWAARNE